MSTESQSWNRSFGNLVILACLLFSLLGCVGSAYLEMVGSILRNVQGTFMQVRHASGFNKYPTKAIKPLGLSGNAMLIIGTGFCLVSFAAVQRSGYFLPHTIGPGRSPVGKLEIDLTPDELKN